VAVERLAAEGFAAKRLRRFKAKGAPKDLEVHEVEAAPFS
jgi:hypothetical protein